MAKATLPARYEHMDPGKRAERIANYKASKAKPMRKRLQDDARAKISCSILTKILINHATGKEIIEDQSRIKAAEILLKKVLPDLSSIEYQEREELPAENQILDRIWGILSAHPDLLRTMHARIQAHLEAGIRPVDAPQEPVSSPEVDTKAA